MMIAGAAILLFIEATGNYVRCGGENGGAAADDVSGTIREDNEPTPNFSLNGLIKGVWAAFMHFLWNGPKHDPRTPMGKLALFALSFHTLIIAASYTASLAGFLATSSTVPIEVVAFPSSRETRDCEARIARLGIATTVQKKAKTVVRRQCSHL